VTIGVSDLDPTYDANGNQTHDGKDYTYLYDAWNRLVSISTTGGSPTLVAAYRYNGLGQRITEGDGTDTEHLMYDDRWRLVSRHDGSDYTEEVMHHAAGLDGFGGASDVDSVIMRRTFLTTGSPQTEDERYYILQNWRQDPAVTITDAGVQVERAHFSPYGRVLGMPAGDTDFDFAFDSDDQSTLSGWSGAYQAHADVDLDGDVDSDDATANTSVTMGWDVLSSVGSKIGYAGYVQDAYVPTVSHVRYRVLKVDLGRWLQRDPAGYVDGANLYEYVMSSPLDMVYRMGLASGSGLGSGCGIGGAVGTLSACGPGGGGSGSSIGQVDCDAIWKTRKKYSSGCALWAKCVRQQQFKGSPKCSPTAESELLACCQSGRSKSRCIEQAREAYQHCIRSIGRPQGQWTPRSGYPQVNPWKCALNCAGCAAAIVAAGGTCLVTNWACIVALFGGLVAVPTACYDCAYCREVIIWF